MTTPAPNTVVRKTRAAIRVFGDSFATDLSQVVDDSLSYSTATEKRSERKQSSVNNDENAPNLAPLPKFSTSPAAKPQKKKAPLMANDGGSGKSKRVCFASLPCEEEYKEEGELQQQQDQENSSFTTTSSVETSQIRNAFYQNLSPPRPDLVRQMQEEMRKATNSVNQTMTMGTKAHNNRYNLAATKSAWEEQLQEAKEFNDQMHERRLRLLNMKKQAASEGSREKAHRHQVQRSHILARIEKESQFNSLVYRAQQKTLREEEKRRRRMSVADRAKLRENAAEGEEEMRQARQKEEEALMEERNAASLARREKLAKDAAARRTSFVFRNGDARRIRELRRIQEMERQGKEHDSFLKKQQANRDMDKYKRQLAIDRRNSLARRNAEAAEQRKREMQRLAQEQEARGKSYKLKFEAERDAAKYKKQLEDERRQSLAFRNQEARRIREFEANKESKEFQEEHEYYESKWQGERDAAAYKKKLETERRQSLAFRNDERHRHASVMEQLREIALEKEHEAYTDKWHGENDAKAYLAQLKKEHRESLKLRGQQVLEGRRVEEESRNKELVQLHQDEELKAEDQKAVCKYQEECAARDRNSLAFRGKELCRQHLEMSVDEEKQKEVERKNHELESLARKDVDEYLKECRRRRRMSLATRAKETRRYASWKREQEEKERQERRQLVHGRLMDLHSVELARQEERAKEALEAIRHARKIKTNPFAGLF